MTIGAKDAIRSQMKQMGMTDDVLVEGCRQIVAEYDAAKAAAAAEAEKQHTQALKEELARQAHSSGDPHKDLMDGIIRNMTKG